MCIKMVTNIHLLVTIKCFNITSSIVKILNLPAALFQLAVRLLVPLYFFITLFLYFLFTCTVALHFLHFSHTPSRLFSLSFAFVWFQPVHIMLPLWRLHICIFPPYLPSFLPSSLLYLSFTHATSRLTRLIADSLSPTLLLCCSLSLSLSLPWPPPPYLLHHHHYYLCSREKIDWLI